MPLLLVNQTIGPLFADVVEAAKRRSPVIVFRGIAYQRTPASARLLTWIGFTVQLGWHLLLHGRRYERILVVSNPPFAPLLAPLAGRPFALLLYDLYPHVLQQIQLLPPRIPGWLDPLQWITSLWHRINRWVFSQSQRVFTLSEAMAMALRPAFASEAAWRAKVMVVSPWADTTNLQPVPSEQNPFRQQHNLDDRLLLCYSGNQGLTHPLEPLIEAAAALHGRAQVLLIGSGPKRQALQRLAEALAIPARDLCFIERLPADQLRFSTSAADFAVVALDGPAATASLPSKTFTALACGTAILALAPENSALACLVKQHGCGVVIEPGPQAASQIIALVDHFNEHPLGLLRMQTNAFHASKQYTPANAEILISAWESS